VVDPYGVNENDDPMLLPSEPIALTIGPVSEFTAAKYHHAMARDFAERHFTDPDVTIADAAAYAGVHPRTLARSLSACGTSWHPLLHELRVARAKQLLETTRYPIDDVARLSGYSSRSAFARAFGQAAGLKPSEYRRAKKGPARAGGATGAFAKRKRPVRPGMTAGFDAVMAQQTHEAQERVADRHELERGYPGASIAEIAAEVTSPRRMREDPAYWREGRREFERWVEENNARPPAADDDDDDIFAWQK
jgi:AraC-like DNA-binding protein